MLDNCQSAKERWGGVHSIIDRWLQERQEMLVEYCALSDVGPFDDTNPEHGERVKRLCQIMMDYVSAGHFEIYDQLIKEGREFEDDEGLTTANELYKIIDPTTEILLDFNDKYEAIDDLSSLSEDLSTVGQALATRFESEDKMIAVLHDAHKDLVA